jgi:hypothetical protein
MNARIPHVAVIAMALVAVGCGGATGGGGGVTPPPTPVPGLVGIPLPTEVSAVPPRASVGGSSTLHSLASLVTLPGASTDYGKAVARKYVDERAVNQFEVLNTIFNAIAQTRYADEANLNIGPYAAIVTWLDDSNGVQVKKLQKWIVDSRRTDAQSPNALQIWMPDMTVGGQGQTALVQANLVITTAPVQNLDGSYRTFGAWRMDVSAPEVAGWHFVAQAEMDASGQSIVKLFQENPGDGVTKGILSKGADSGFGKVWFPEWNSGVPQQVYAAYAYDASTVLVKKGADLATATPVAKSRTDLVALVNRYALFEAVTGVNVASGRQFSFPFTWMESGVQHWGGYNAWQGRHALWANGQTLPEGTVVTRGDRAPGAAAVTYTVSQVYPGILVKRTLVDATLDQIAGAVGQTNVQYQDQIMRVSDGTWWSHCNIAMPDVSRCTNLNEPPGSLMPNASPYTGGFDRFAYDPGNTQRWLNLMIWDPTTSPPFSGPVVYVKAGGFPGVSEDGFYAAEFPAPQPNSPPPMARPATPIRLIVPGAGARLDVNGSENIWVSYTGTIWVQKSVASIDPSTFMPTFVPGGDLPFTLAANREYYLNDRGVNYVVLYDGTATSVRVEQQTAANPVNAASLLQGVSFLRLAWGDGTTYEFQPATLRLVVKTPATGSQARAGDAVTTGLWGLTAYDLAAQSLGFQFNWEYPQGGSGQGWGSQQFLLDGQGRPVILEDPIMLEPEQLADGAGNLNTYSLQFDGNWVGGLPEIWNELQASGFNVTETIQGEAVTIPADKVFTDATDASKTYLFKPMEVAEYLVVLPNYAGSLTTASAQAMDLATVPSFQDPGMASLSRVNDAPLKFVEGVAVQ